MTKIVQLSQISSRYFTAGIEVNLLTDRVEMADPIVSYMKGWSSKRLSTYCNYNKWNLRPINDE